MTNDLEVMEAKIADKLEIGAPLIPIAANKGGGVMFTNFGQVIDFAKEMSISSLGVRKHLRGNVGACVAVIVQAIEWEMSPFAVASKSYNVNDVLAYEAQLINAVILRRAPIKGRFHPEYSGDDDAPRLRVWVDLRDEDGGGQLDYKSPPFHKIQPKNSPLWKNDPEQQLFYYSSRALCRRHFPDVLLGVYAVDEILDSEPMDRRSRIAAPKGINAKLGQLANMPLVGHSSSPDTGEILDNEHPPAPRSEQNNGRDEAAAGGTASVERRAEPQTSQDLEGGSAPDPRHGNYNASTLSSASGGQPSDVSRDEAGDGRGAGGTPAMSSVGSASVTPVAPKGAEVAVARQGPQTGGEARAEAPSQASPPATSTAADEARKARVAEIRIEGQAAAEDGQTALMNYLESLRERGQADWASSTLKNSWRETAKAADAAKAKGDRK